MSIVSKFQNLLRNPKFAEFLRFCVVGAICTIIDAGVFYAIHDLTGYRIAIVCGFIISLAFNYVLNIYWTFKSKPSVSNSIGLILAHCFNIFVVRFSLMWLFVDTLGFTENVGYIPTLIISMFTNFIIIRLIVNKL